MSVIVTGGAGFIGSCIVRMLNDKGIEDIIVVDNISLTDKWKNLINKKYTAYVHKNEFLQTLPALSGKVECVIHMGACSATTEKDFDYLYKNNFEYSKTLWNFCIEQNISFIYASSAATYGDGDEGFDDEADISTLRPMNGYGYSKQIFDIWAAKQEKKPPQHVGFKFFNVYGPNEYFKDSMASVIYHAFNQIHKTGQAKLFKSYKPEYEDGAQKRDFVYVKDICNIVEFVIEHPGVSGLFNLGTGIARTFKDLVIATFAAIGQQPDIEFIEMPFEIRDRYQYYTEATMEKLKKAGYEKPFYSLENGIKDYVQNYLTKGNAIY